MIGVGKMLTCRSQRPSKRFHVGAYVALGPLCLLEKSIFGFTGILPGFPRNLISRIVDRFCRSPLAVFDFVSKF